MYSEPIITREDSKTTYKIKNRIRTVSKIERYDFEMKNFDYSLLADAKTRILHRRKGLMSSPVNAAYEDVIENTKNKGVYLLVLMWEYKNIVLYESLGFEFIKYCSVSGNPYVLLAKGYIDKSQLCAVNFK